MNPSRFLAFDIGASSGRGVLGELKDNVLHTRELCRFPNGMINILGHLHWNIFALFEQVKEGLRLCSKQPENLPSSVGIDTWGVDFGLLGSDGSIMGLPFGYRDRRTEGAMDSFFQKVPRERVYDLTGIQFLPFNTLFQLEAMFRDRSPILEVAEDLLFIPDLLNYLMTGVKTTEFTFATTSQLYNPVKREWEDELLSALGLSGNLMQDIVTPGTVIGETMPEISGETGLERIPVVAVATHDTGSAVAAVPADGNDWAYISSGTWSLMGVEVGEPVINERSMALNFTNEGGVDGTFRLLKNIAGLWLLEECRRIWDRKYNYDELMELSDSAKPFEAFIDPDREEFLNPVNMPETVQMFCRNTKQTVPDSRGAIVRCILESLAMKYRFVLDQLLHLSPRPVNRIHIIGGGVRNRLLCQLTANATGVPVIAGPAEATAIGNIMVQALSAGHVSSLPEIRGIIGGSFELEKYVPRQVEDWDKAYNRFREIIEQ